MELFPCQAAGRVPHESIEERRESEAEGDGSGQQEDVGHQVYPLIDTETSTEPVPVYKGSPPPVPSKESRGRLAMLAALAVGAVLLWYFTRSQ